MPFDRSPARSRQGRRHPGGNPPDLDSRYGKIGFRAVAAAARYPSGTGHPRDANRPDADPQPEPPARARREDVLA